MPIKVEHEPGELDTFCVEKCCFCWAPTRYWYKKKDVAVCPTCAKSHKVSEVPKKVEWCRQHRERFPSPHYSI